ncbi:MAG: DUF6941 family protein [Gaiellales bacterium]
MRMDGFMLARYAEQTAGGLVIAGGGWTTWNVTEPLQAEGNEVPPAAVIQGFVVCRLMLTPEESDGGHPLVLRLLDSDDQEMFRGELRLDMQRDPELPRSWEQLATVIVPLGWVPVPGFGLYRFLLETPAGDTLGACPFQVVKRF